MTIISKTTSGTIFRCAFTALTMVWFVACGSKPDPGPTPKPPWPDSPTAPSLGNPRPTVLNSTSPLPPPVGRKSDVALIALADVWVLVKLEGQNEIWKNILKGERLVIPKTGKMSITYSSGKNLRIEANGQVVKPDGGTESVGFLDLD